ncbi:hypothetical protein NDU88_002440 [Pleurodeles waltl]|uniref:Uncharacterized protein n=1 Tax=Pleurodeles waltl TaxID=8319 RepID=A0AAV7TL70_PLEWA|nr:hypothetical protein NDU88_002440 [Pleurodeles waltl]
MRARLSPEEFKSKYILGEEVKLYGWRHLPFTSNLRGRALRLKCTSRGESGQVSASVPRRTSTMASGWEARRKEKSVKLFFAQMDEGSGAQPGRGNMKVEVKLQTLYDKMEKLHRKELSKWWEVESLQRYIEVGRVPRGLRIYTIPTYEDPDPEMLEEWAENSKQSSLNMMRILTKYAIKDRSKILEEMEKVRLELLSLVTQETFDEFMKNLEKKLCKLEEEITGKKQRKYIRDFKDYQASRILTFQRKYDHMYNEGITEIAHVLAILNRNRPFYLPFTVMLLMFLNGK